MINNEAVYAALQFPMVLMLAALAIVLAMRARAAYQGVLEYPSVVLLSLLAAFMAVWTIRLGWWHVRWVLRALDLHTASASMTDRVIVPMLCNLVGLSIGGAILTISSRPHLGRLAAPVVVSCVAVSIGVGGLLAGAWR